MRTLPHILIILIVSMLTATAQKAPMKWGSVPEEDLQLSTYELDPEADAVVLCDYTHISFDFGDPNYLIRENAHLRIKILNQQGAEQLGDVSIRYYARNKSSQIVNIKAQVIQPNGKTIKVDKKQIFHEDMNDSWSRYTFSFPAVQVGSVLEYKYTRQSNYQFTLIDKYFQREIPIRWTELRAEIPEWYEYVKLTQGAVPDIADVKSERRDIQYRYNEGGTATGASRSAITDAVVDYHRYVLKDVPALKEENYITSMENYYNRMRFQLRAYNFPGVARELVMNSWAKVAEELWESEFFGKRLGARRPVQKALEAMGGPDALPADRMEQIEAVYNFVNENFAWNDLYSITMRQNIGELLNTRKGTSGELNLLLAAMLRHLDFAAFPVLISTRRNGKTVELYPFLDQFNHVLVLVEEGGSQILLDVSGDKRPVGMVRENALNYRGWLVDETQPRWIDIEVPRSNRVYYLNMACQPDGTLAGSAKVQFTGYYGKYQRQVIASESEDYIQTTFAAESDLTYENVDISHAEEYRAPLKIQFDFSMEGQGEEDADRIYVSPIVFGRTEENPFKSGTREYPVEIPYPFDKKYIANISLPDGYEVESVPQGAHIKLPDNAGFAKYYLTLKPGEIQLLLDFKISKLQYQPEEYEQIKQLYDMWIEKSGELIVLKKIG